VVFWSGIVDADSTKREVVYDVPDYFDGTLKIMAVAIADDAVASGERETLIRGPFVITPSVPVLAAPGDEFETGVTVANNVEGSGPNSARKPMSNCRSRAARRKSYRSPKAGSKQPSSSSAQRTNSVPEKSRSSRVQTASKQSAAPR
jgi:hypothetical protein